MKNLLVLAVFAASLLLAGCSGGGGGGGESGPDPILGIWELTAKDGGPPAGMSQVLVFDSTGSFVAGIDDGSGSCAVGTWTRTSAGHYDWVAYSNDEEAEGPQFGTGTVSGNTLTLPNVQMGDDGTATLTFTRFNASNSSSDPILGYWELAQIYDAGSWHTAESYEVSAQMAVQDGGSFTGGMHSPGYTDGFIGTWTQASAGSYEYTVYSNAGEGSVQTDTATLTEYLEIPDFYLGSVLGPRNVKFQKHPASYTASDSIIGRWTLTAINGGPPGDKSWVFAFLDHGVFVGGMAGGDDLGCIVGVWSPPEDTGEYGYIVYPYDLEEGSPPDGAMTVSGNTLTLPNVDMGEDTVTLTFARF